MTASINENGELFFTNIFCKVKEYTPDKYKSGRYLGLAPCNLQLYNLRKLHVIYKNYNRVCVIDKMTSVTEA